MEDLHNAAGSLLAGDLPILESSLLAANRCLASDPADTRSFSLLRCDVIKDQSGLARHELGIKGIVHEHEDVHIVWGGLRRHKGPKNDESGQLSCAPGQRVNARQALGDYPTLQGARPEMRAYFRQGGLV